MAAGDPANRPPVLAHQRFAADRAAFDGLTLAARFDRIHATNLWGAAETKSGLGSVAAAMSAVRTALPEMLARLGATSLLDAPCGDAGWIDSIPAEIGYIGQDIVPTVVSEAKALFPRGDFRVGDITRDPLPYSDAILCRDCLVHLSFANIARAVANFRASGATWLLTTTFPDLGVNRDCDDGDWRGLNFELPPFAWGPSVATIVEGCDEADGGWADKALAVWRLDAIS
jgi:hypothetical protein